MADLHTDPPDPPDLIDLIPDPETVRGWLAETRRRSDLLRSLLSLARRKAAYRTPTSDRREEVSGAN